MIDVHRLIPQSNNRSDRRVSKEKYRGLGHHSLGFTIHPVDHTYLPVTSALPEIAKY
jgi:hypothetical protein